MLKRNDRLVVLAILIGMAFAGGVSAQAAVQAGNESPPTNPALQRFGRAITFYASFDGFTTADLSAGDGNPMRGVQTRQWTKGLWERALLTPTPRLQYASAKNIDLSKPGSMAVWVCLLSQKSGRLPWLVIRDHGYTVYVERNQGKRQTLVALFDPNLHDPKARARSRNGVTTGWRIDRWHLLAFNWTNGHIGFSVDGAVFQRGILRRRAKPEAKPDETMDVGGGSAKAPECGMDELMILNRPMTNEEVQWLWDSRKMAQGPE